MTVQVGDIIPDATLHYVPFDPEASLQTCTRPLPYNLHEKLKGKKAVIFAIPGPFTPTCSETHVPGFIAAADALRAKGVAEIICVSVIDGFVMNAFAKVAGSGNKIIMAGDGNGALTKALGLEADLSKAGLGLRSKRFALVVEDLVVKYVGVEEAPGVSVSGAEAVLAKL
ncbi:Redoxin [Dichotomocladium elegans]|nr:Redoxin [Dichotomocladium elegans]